MSDHIKVGDRVTWFERGAWNETAHRTVTGRVEGIEWIPVGNPTYIVVNEQYQRKRMKLEKLTRLTEPARLP